MKDCTGRAEQIAMAANTLAALLARRLTLDEQNIVGNLLAAAGATLLSIAAIGESCSNASEDASGDSKDTAKTKDAADTGDAENSEKTGGAAAAKSAKAACAPARPQKSEGAV